MVKINRREYVLGNYIVNLFLFICLFFFCWQDVVNVLDEIFSLILKNLIIYQFNVDVEVNVILLYLYIVFNLRESFCKVLFYILVIINYGLFINN